VLTYNQSPKICRSEDVELSSAIRLFGYKGWYDDSLILYHYINKEKLTWNYLIYLIINAASAQPIMRIYYSLLATHKSSTKFLYLRMILNLVVSYFKFLLKREVLLVLIKHIIQIDLGENITLAKITFKYTEFFEAFRLRRKIFKTIKQAKNIYRGIESIS